MIGYIKGIVEELGFDYVVIDNNGIGYKLNVSANTMMNLEQGKETKIYSKMIVREDDISLCGFSSKEEQAMFELVTSVSKIGTKVGMSILSYADPATLSRYIVSSDVQALSKAPGVGKKTAERMVLELKDKVGKLSFTDVGNDQPVDLKSLNVDNSADEAIEALSSLGYSLDEAKNAVLFVKQPGMGVEDIIMKALEYIAKAGI